MPTADTRWKTWLILLFGVSLTALFFYMMAPFIVAFLLSAVIAIIANPLFVAARRKMPPGMAAASTTAVISFLILAPLGLLLFSGGHRLVKLIGTMKVTSPPFSLSGLEQTQWLRNAASWASHYVAVDREWVRDQAKDVLMTVGETISRTIANSLAAMPSFLLAFFVVTISVFFLLKDGEKFLEFLESLSPAPLTRSRELYDAFQSSCRGVVLSLAASALVQGVLMAIFAAITHLQNVVLLGMLTVVMGLVPVVGSAPVWIGATLYLFFQGSTGYAIVMLVGGILISTSDNIVRPIILKGHSQMHPLLALVSVFGAINLVGATGIFLGPIIAAVFVSFLKILSLENRRGREFPVGEIGPPSGGLA